MSQAVSKTRQGRHQGRCRTKTRIQQLQGRQEGLLYVSLHREGSLLSVYTLLYQTRVWDTVWRTEL